jgi:cholesterol transport system auxiliary component
MTAFDANIATGRHMRVFAAGLLLSGLAGCSLLGGSKEPLTIYAPEPAAVADASWPTATWQLAIARPEAPRMLDSLRIAVRPTPNELEVYKGVSWAKSPGEQFEDAVLHGLEDSGRIRAVARVSSGIAADYTLVTELRRFEADYAGRPVPSAVIEISAKLVSARDQEVVASRIFHQDVPATNTDPASVADAFGRALGQVAHDVDGWVLASGNAASASAAKATR